MAQNAPNTMQVVTKHPKTSICMFMAVQQLWLIEGDSFKDTSQRHFYHIHCLPTKEQHVVNATVNKNAIQKAKVQKNIHKPTNKTRKLKSSVLPTQRQLSSSRVSHRTYTDILLNHLLRQQTKGYLNYTLQKWKFSISVLVISCGSQYKSHLCLFIQAVEKGLTIV